MGWWSTPSMAARRSRVRSRSSRLGRLAPGYEFDAVLLDDDPGDAETFTRPTGVTGVFKRGVPVVRHPRLPTEAKETARAWSPPYRDRTGSTDPAGS